MGIRVHVKRVWLGPTRTVMQHRGGTHAGEGWLHPAVAGTHEVSWIRASGHKDGPLGLQSCTHGVSWMP